MTDEVKRTNPKKKRNFSPAQLAAQKKFAAKARKRNTTVIKAKRVKIGGANPGLLSTAKRTAKKAISKIKKLAGNPRKIGSVWIETRGTSHGYDIYVVKVKTASHPQGANMGESRDSALASEMAGNLRKKIKAKSHDVAWVFGEQNSRRRRRNAEKKDSDHPVEVTHHYRAGPPGYMTPWQRAHAAGQKQLFETGIKPATRRNPHHVSDIEAIRAQALFGSGKIWIKDGQKEGLILASKYGPAWWKRAKAADIRRIVIWDNPRSGERKIAATKREARKAVKGVRALTRKLRTKRKGNPSKTTRIREKFTGQRVRKVSTLRAPDGTPRDLAKLGTLVSIKAEQGTVKPARRNPGSAVWLCADSRGKLHLCTSGERLIEGPARSFGEIEQIEYETAKPHLGNRATQRFFHDMGEDGGQRPTLYADGKGGLKIRGGDYRITAEGLIN